MSVEDYRSGDYGSHFVPLPESIASHQDFKGAHVDIYEVNRVKHLVVQSTSQSGTPYLVDIKSNIPDEDKKAIVLYGVLSFTVL